MAYADGRSGPVYVAHFESGSAANAPLLAPADVTGLLPGDITGDLVAAFAPPTYRLQLGGRALRLVVRALPGTCARDAEVYLAG